MLSLGPFPNARNAADWTRFGDMLAKDVNAQALTYNHLWLKKAIKERGGVAAIWRELFKNEVPALIQRYGYPSQNLRSNVMFVPYVPQQCYQAQPPPNAQQPNTSPQVPPGTWVGSGPAADPRVVAKAAGCASDSAAGKSDSGSSSDSSDSSDCDNERKTKSLPGNFKENRDSLDNESDRRERIRSRSPAATGYTDVWIVAGDEALHPGFLSRVEEESQKSGWVLDKVKLPADLVLHTGVALSHMLFCLDSGILGAKMKKSANIHCVVSEGCLKAWPKHGQAAFKGRLDNINHCLRAFGVDGRSTKFLEKEQKREHSNEHLLRSALKTFIILGDGPVGCVDVKTYRERLSWLNKRVLSEDNLIEELVYAHGHSPNEAPNGVKIWRNGGGETDDMLAEMCAKSGSGSNVLVIVMDPAGRPLSPKW